MEQNLENALMTAPVQAQERIETLDVIRGVALLGILFVNMSWFSAPGMYLEALGKSMWTEVWNTATSSFISLFFQGKFYSMFSILFGLGFVIFYDRAKTRTLKPTWLFYKRLFILLLIGLVHSFFIWHGDILVSYAVSALLLPLFFNRKPKTILVWVVVFFAIFLSIVALGAFAMGFLDEAMRATMLDDMKNRLESSFYAYGQGTFADIMAQRASDTLFAYSNLLITVFLFLPLFLLGVYVAKKGILQHLEANMSFIKKAWLWGLMIGLPASIAKYIIGYQVNMLFLTNLNVLHFGLGILGDTGLSIFYMTSIILLFRRQNWVSKLRPFGYVGRMALSNYLLQSVIGTMIFYNYGLGLYGQIAPAFGMAWALVIFVIQIIISKWWLSCYQFGPVEWLWKSLTYSKRFGMRQ